jgi:hypothetical protein
MEVVHTAFLSDIGLACFLITAVEHCRGLECVRVPEPSTLASFHGQNGLSRAICLLAASPVRLYDHLGAVSEPPPGGSLLPQDLPDDLESGRDWLCDSDQLGAPTLTAQKSGKGASEQR